MRVKKSVILFSLKSMMGLTLPFPPFSSLLTHPIVLFLPITLYPFINYLLVKKSNLRSLDLGSKNKKIKFKII